MMANLKHQVEMAWNGMRYNKLAMDQSNIMKQVASCLIAG